MAVWGVQRAAALGARNAQSSEHARIHLCLPHPHPTPRSPTVPPLPLPTCLPLQWTLAQPWYLQFPASRGHAGVTGADMCLPARRAASRIRSEFPPLHAYDSRVQEEQAKEQAPKASEPCAVCIASVTRARRSLALHSRSRTAPSTTHARRLIVCVRARASGHQAGQLCACTVDARAAQPFSPLHQPTLPAAVCASACGCEGPDQLVRLG